LIDVDDFKAINDRYGHVAGGDVLSIVADALLSAFRLYDVTARLGGDEFAFCLAVRDTASAERKSRETHDAVMAALTQADYGATCSLGAATGVDVADTLRVADQTLYRAKDAGKSKWIFEVGARSERGEPGCQRVVRTRPERNAPYIDFLLLRQTDLNSRHIEFVVLRILAASQDLRCS
jgi:diguanylate cyclase (GGDEF)-like protein